MQPGCEEVEVVVDADRLACDHVKQDGFLEVHCELHVHLGDGLKVVQDGQFWCDGLTVGFLGIL